MCVCFLSFGLSLFDRFKVKLTPGTARRGKGSKSYTEFLQKMFRQCSIVNFLCIFVANSDLNLPGQGIL